MRSSSSPCAALLALLAGRECPPCTKSFRRRPSPDRRQTFSQNSRTASRHGSLPSSISSSSSSSRAVKRHVEHIVEAFHQQNADALAQHRRRKASLVLAHVLALDDRRNNRSVRGRPPDAFFFQILYQRRFRIARRRLGEVLVRPNLIEPQDLPFRPRAAASCLRLRRPSRRLRGRPRPPAVWYTRK